jgi:hypothetical protein
VKFARLILSGNGQSGGCRFAHRTSNEKRKSSYERDRAIAFIASYSTKSEILMGNP